MLAISVTDTDGDLVGSVRLSITDATLRQVVPVALHCFELPGSAFRFEESGNDGSKIFVATIDVDRTALNIPEKLEDELMPSDLEPQVVAIFSGDGTLAEVKAPAFKVDYDRTNLGLD